MINLSKIPVRSSKPMNIRTLQHLDGPDIQSTGYRQAYKAYAGGQFKNVGRSVASSARNAISASRNAAAIARVGYNAGRAGGQMTRGFAGSRLDVANTVGRYADSMRAISNMSAAAKTLANVTRIGAYVYTTGIPVGTKWVGKNLARVGTGIWLVAKLVIKNTLTYSWKLVKFVNSVVKRTNKVIAKTIVSKDPKNFQPIIKAFKTKAKVQEISVKRQGKAVKRVEKLLYGGEVGLAAYKLNSVLKKEKKDLFGEGEDE